MGGRNSKAAGASDSSNKAAVSLPIDLLFRCKDAAAGAIISKVRLENYLAVSETEFKALERRLTLRSADGALSCSHDLDSLKKQLGDGKKWKRSPTLISMSGAISLASDKLLIALAEVEATPTAGGKKSQFAVAFSAAGILATFSSSCRSKTFDLQLRPAGEKEKERLNVFLTATLPAGAVLPEGAAAAAAAEGSGDGSTAAGGAAAAAMSPKPPPGRKAAGSGAGTTSTENPLSPEAKAALASQHLLASLEKTGRGEGGGAGGAGGAGAGSSEPEALISVLPHHHTVYCDRKRVVCTAEGALREGNRLHLKVHLPSGGSLASLFAAAAAAGGGAAAAAGAGSTGGPVVPTLLHCTWYRGLPVSGSAAAAPAEEEAEDSAALAAASAAGHPAFLQLRPQGHPASLLPITLRPVSKTAAQDAVKMPAAPGLQVAWDADPSAAYAALLANMKLAVDGGQAGDSPLFSSSAALRLMTNEARMAESDPAQYFLSLKDCGCYLAAVVSIAAPVEAASSRGASASTTAAAPVGEAAASSASPASDSASDSASSPAVPQEGESAAATPAPASVAPAPSAPAPILITSSLIGPIQPAPPRVREIWVEGSCKVGEVLRACAHYYGGRPSATGCCFSWIRVDAEGNRTESEPLPYDPLAPLASPSAAGGEGAAAVTFKQMVKGEGLPASLDPRMLRLSEEDRGCQFKVSCEPVRTDGSKGAPSTSKLTEEVQA